MEEQLGYLKKKITKSKAHIACNLLKETSLEDLKAYLVFTMDTIQQHFARNSMRGNKMKEKEYIRTKHETLTTTKTPLHTIDWYIKWFASIVLLIGMVLTSNNVYPLNIFVHGTGAIGWTAVGYMTADRAILTNFGLQIPLFIVGNIYLLT